MRIFLVVLMTASMFLLPATPTALANGPECVNGAWHAIDWEGVDRGFCDQWGNPSTTAVACSSAPAPAPVPVPVPPAPTTGSQAATPATTPVYAAPVVTPRVYTQGTPTAREIRAALNGWSKKPQKGWDLYVKPGTEAYPAVVVPLVAAPALLDSAALITALSSPVTWGVVIVGGVVIAIIVVSTSEYASWGELGYTWEEVQFMASKGAPMQANRVGELYSSSSVRAGRWTINNCPPPLAVHICKNRGGGDPCNRLNDAKRAYQASMEKCYRSTSGALRYAIYFSTDVTGVALGDSSSFWSGGIKEGFEERPKGECAAAESYLAELAKLAVQVSCP